MNLALTSERLMIRSTQKNDTSFCIDIWQDEEMGRYLSDPTREKAGTIYDEWAETIDQYEGCYYFVAVSKQDGHRIGTCSTVPSKDLHTWDIGYTIHKKYWRQGYATEMLTTLIDFCKQNGARAITADVAKENPGSNAVMKKLGFKVIKEGAFKKSGTDLVFEEYTYQLKW